MRVNSVKTETDHIIEDYSDVLGDEIGCWPGEYNIKIDQTVTPAIHAPRPVPAAIREQLKRELDHLQLCGIIVQETEPTNWVKQLSLC